MQREKITNWQGRIVGFIDTDELTGNKVARDFYGRIVGKYQKQLDITTDFYGRRLAKGDRLMMTIDMSKNK